MSKRQKVLDLLLARMDEQSSSPFSGDSTQDVPITEQRRRTAQKIVAPRPTQSAAIQTSAVSPISISSSSPRNIKVEQMSSTQDGIWMSENSTHPPQQTRNRKVQARQHTHFNFLGLPAEARQRVYEVVLQSKSDHKWHGYTARQPKRTSILRVCKQVYREAMEVFRSRVTLHLSCNNIENFALITMHLLREESRRFGLIQLKTGTNVMMVKNLDLATFDFALQALKTKERKPRLAKLYLGLQYDCDVAMARQIALRLKSTFGIADKGYTLTIYNLVKKMGNDLKLMGFATILREPGIHAEIDELKAASGAS